MKSLDQFDPLPKLGAKVQTEVVYYHQEEKEIKPHLYEKDGKLRYAPPVPETREEMIWRLAGPIINDFGGWITGVEAVEEEKQDNKPTRFIEEKQGDEREFRVGDRVRTRNGEIGVITRLSDSGAAWFVQVGDVETYYFETSLEKIA